MCLTDMQMHTTLGYVIMCVSDLRLINGLYGQLRFPPPTKDPDDINETLLNAVLNIHKIKFVTYHRFATRVKRRLPLVEQELPTLPGHPVRSRRFSIGLLLFNLFFSVQILGYIVVCPLVLFLLTILLSLRFTASDYLFDIFKLFVPCS